MSTCRISQCSGVPGRAPSMSTCRISQCSGVPGRAPSMSTSRISQCSGVPGRAPIISNMSKNGTKEKSTRASPATTTTTTTLVTNAQLKALIDQGVADALAARNADRSMNGDDSHNSGKGVMGLIQCFEKRETVFHTATVQSHKTLKKMMTNKYCTRGEIKKLEIEMWNLKVKGTNVDAIEFATELMDKKINNKRKLDNNNQVQQQPPKKQGVAIAYTARSGERKEISHCSSVPGRAPSMSTCRISQCSGVPGRASSINTCRISQCSGVPGRAPIMSTCPLSQCSGVLGRALVLLYKLPSKEKDPRSFTIPCHVGDLHINNTLADLGANISLMPYVMYEKLGPGEPKPTRMSLELADRSIQYPRGIVENVLIKVNKFVVPIDFVILDMHEDSRILIILGRRFLATAQAMIDVFNKKTTLRVGDDEMIFDMEQSMKRPPSEDEKCYSKDELDDNIHERTQELLEKDQLDSFLLRYQERGVNQMDLDICSPAKLNEGEPWYADYVSYIIGKVVPTKWSPEGRKRAIEITDKNGFSFKVNGQRLRKYFEGNIDKENKEIGELKDEATECLPGDKSNLKTSL
uniref:Reverse transcriptase domain-containing protein n=1 Tax=Tanacetum cinerariifolium TaxID=118510 RepID=A0A6L2N6R5_TANCI|nr:hypothetical protein [Tanacetum cinerariifolium]